jgi:predicted ATPase/DNA-binding SARP family transcriptional activator
MLEIFTFGGVEVNLDGVRVKNFHSKKSIALLVFLALAKKPVPRQKIAAILWEDSSEAQAHNNLRVVLSGIRKALPNYVETDRDTLSLSNKQSIWIDVLNFKIFINASRIRSALSIYHGEFMQGFFLRDCAEFENWMVSHQEQFHEELLAAIYSRLLQCLEAGSYSEGIYLARHYLTLNPLSERVYFQLVSALVLSGQREAAIIEYDKCKEILDQELGIEPSRQIRLLFRNIKNGKVGAIYKQTNRRSNLPEYATPILGRNEEIDFVCNIHKENKSNLVTVVGPGGVGKTRLVCAVGEQLAGSFQEGICFVPLAGLASDSQIFPSIAKSLEIPIQPNAEIEGQVISYLNKRNILLILDNFEHLDSGAEQLNSLVLNTRNLFFLVSSRKPVQINSETVFYLNGLSIITDKKEDINQESEAAKLFHITAHKFDAQQDFSKEERAEIQYICEQVDGLPLAIILAASWTDTLSVHEISNEIAKGFQRITSELLDIPERHRSIRAVFEHSWKLLASRERESFARLSVFRDGFSLDAAQKIAGCSLISLKSLVGQSLVRRTISGRYSMHELVRQFACEKLDAQPDNRKTAEAKHCKYFLQQLKEWEFLSKGRRQYISMKNIEHDKANVLVAWNWAIKDKNAALLTKGTNGLMILLQWLSLSKEGIIATQNALDVLSAKGNLQNTTLISNLLVWQAIFHRTAANDETAIENVIVAFNSLQSVDVRSTQTIMTIAFAMTRLASWGGKKHLSALNQSPKTLLDSALSIYEELDAIWEKAFALKILAWEYRLEAKFKESVEMLSMSLNIFDKLKDSRMSAETLSTLSIVCREWGELARADYYAQRSADKMLHSGDQAKTADSLQNLGWNHFWGGRFAEGASAHQESQSLFSDIGLEIDALWVLMSQSWCELHLGNYDTTAQITSLVGKNIENVQSFTYILNMIVVALRDIKYTDFENARAMLQEAQSMHKNMRNYDQGGLEIALLGLVDTLTGNYSEARSKYIESLVLAEKFGGYYIYVHLFPSAALLFAENGKIDQANRTYEIAKKTNFVANSVWMEDVLGSKVSKACKNISQETPKQSSPTIWNVRDFNQSAENLRMALAALDF